MRWSGQQHPIVAVLGADVPGDLPGRPAPVAVPGTSWRFDLGTAEGLGDRAGRPSTPGWKTSVAWCDPT